RHRSLKRNARNRQNKVAGPRPVSSRRCAEAPLPRCELRRGDLLFGIRNVINPLLSLQDIYRVLKPSGRCLILEFSLPPKPIRGFYLFYLRAVLPRLGGLFSRN